MASTKKTPAKGAGNKNKNSKSAAKSKTAAKTTKTSGKSTAQKNGAASENKMHGRLRDEIIAIIFIAIGIFLIIAFQTSAAGAVGTALSQFFKGVFGFVAYILPYYFIIYGILLFSKKTIQMSVKSIVLLVIIFRKIY